MNQPTKFPSTEPDVVNGPASLPRRQVLAGSVSALAAAGLAAFETVANAQTSSVAAKPLPAYVSWKDPNSLIVHSATTIETKRQAFGSGLTRHG